MVETAQRHVRGKKGRGGEVGGKSEGTPVVFFNKISLRYTRFYPGYHRFFLRAAAIFGVDRRPTL